MQSLTEVVYCPTIENINLPSSKQCVGSGQFVRSNHSYNQTVLD
jgi:hypothetical protein